MEHTSCAKEAGAGCAPDVVGSKHEGAHVGGYDSHVHGKASRHEKFTGPNTLASHEVFKNEQKRPSTDEAHEKFYSYIS